MNSIVNLSIMFCGTVVPLREPGKRGGGQMRRRLRGAVNLFYFFFFMEMNH